MELEQIWQQGIGEDAVLSRLLRQPQLEKLHSQMPLRKLKRALLGGMVWAVLITGGYGVLFATVPHWQVRFALVVVSVFNLIIMWDSWRLFRNTNAGIIPRNNLREELQRHYDSFWRWWRIQEKVGLFVYPITITGGFLLGGIIGSGKPVDAFLYRPKILLALVICLIVLVPACYYLARWMFQYSFGRHLKSLRNCIADLEKEDR